MHRIVLSLKSQIITKASTEFLFTSFSPAMLHKYIGCT